MRFVGVPSRQWISFQLPSVGVLLRGGYDVGSIWISFLVAWLIIFGTEFGTFVQIIAWPLTLFAVASLLHLSSYRSAHLHWPSHSESLPRRLRKLLRVHLGFFSICGLGLIIAWRAFGNSAAPQNAFIDIFLLTFLFAALLGCMGRIGSLIVRNSRPTEAAEPAIYENGAKIEIEPLTQATAPKGTLMLKRTMDVVTSIAGLILLLPIFTLIALAVKLDSPGPVFFRQYRVGRNGKLFALFKFRSMSVGASRAGPLLTVQGDKRVTAVGRILRQSKLDELPQLFNVLRGDMSLVGPRPAVPEFMKFYTPEQLASVLSMRPGVTDYASIMFRDERAVIGKANDPIAIYRSKILPIKVALYERYIRETGLWNDIRIILATALLLSIGRVPKWIGIESDPAPHLADAAPARMQGHDGGGIRPAVDAFSRPKPMPASSPVHRIQERPVDHEQVGGSSF
jgi:lipopolysaccharide/colanic/teichoic acid biosynthesis glycosyltransferase